MTHPGAKRGATTGGAVSGTSRAINSAASSGATATTKNTDRQGSIEPSRPLSSRPSVMPSPGPENETAWPTEIFSRGVTAAMMARSFENRQPCARPVATRAASSAAKPPARPVNTEATAPASSPATTMSRRPRRSPSSPAGNWATAYA